VLAGSVDQVLSIQAVGLVVQVVSVEQVVRLLPAQAQPRPASLTQWARSRNAAQNQCQARRARTPISPSEDGAPPRGGGK